MTQREGETCLNNELLLRRSDRLTLNSLMLQWLVSDRLLAGLGNNHCSRRQFNPAKAIFRCLMSVLTGGSFCYRYRGAFHRGSHS